MSWPRSASSEAFVPIAIGLTTTALGTLLPILRDNDMLGGRFGSYILAAGAVGEFLPIVAIAIFLGASGSFVGLLSLLAMGALAGMFTIVPRLVHHQGLRRILAEGEHATSQTTLRWTVFLLFALLSVAEDFGLDVVLGAFLAGVVLRRWAPLDVHALESKLDAVGYGFFIPVFFVSSGMSLDLNAIAEAPERLLVFFLLLLVVRGLPALVFYRHDLALRAAAPDDPADRDRAAAACRPEPDRSQHRRHAPGERRSTRRCRGPVRHGLPRARLGAQPARRTGPHRSSGTAGHSRRRRTTPPSTRPSPARPPAPKAAPNSGSVQVVAH